ncbi:hypothetical protein ACFSCZ_19640 [Siminovitchia sediminis]|uniref:ABC transporter permease n=1 Tax=Siminovitchia sediminis TaxID=1274353 RepID=A0ABW4KPY1_9BACI
MSFIDMSLSDIVKRQYEFKLRAFLGVFTSMVGIQLISILFSLSGVYSVGTGTSTGVSITVSYFSADMIIIFTIIWIFITSVLITTKAFRYDDFTFVANRLSSNMANILFLLTASLIGGASAVLSGFLLKVITFFFGDIVYGTGNSLMEAPAEFFMGMTAVILYMILFASLGYLAGIIVQLHSVFIFLLPAVAIGLGIFFGIRNEGEMGKRLFDFIFSEPSLVTFVIKILVLSAISFTAAVFLSNRMEVRN